jgi:methylmalonyl-CoA mutase N-terminal domain/subunit
MGGMAKASRRYPKMVSKRRPPYTGAHRPGVAAIIGVYRYRLIREDPIDILDIDNTECVTAG